MRTLIYFAAVTFSLLTPAFAERIIVKDKSGNPVSSYTITKSMGGQHIQFRDKNGSPTGSARTNASGTRTQLMDRNGLSNGSTNGRFIIPSNSSSKKK